MGPLLFIIYINDICSVLNRSFISLFADDTLISVSGQNVFEITEIINNELDLLYTWLCQNKLKLNTAKTKCMILGTKRKCKEFLELDLSILFNGTKIDFVSQIKYLGVILDPQLSFCHYLDFIDRKLGKKIGFFRRISCNLTVWARHIVFNTMVLPHFKYCSSVLLSCTKEQVNRLQLQQNKVMRILLNCGKYTPIHTMLECLGWLSVKQCIKQANLLLIFKIKNNLCADYFNNYLTKRSNVHTYFTRSNDLYNIDFTRSTSLQNTLFIEGINMYNKLPDHIKISPNLKIFTNKVYKYLRYNY